MKIAFVVPRLEPQLAGGAEVLCQKLAERIAGRGNDVELLTTCARDHFTWKNYYEPGSKKISGITIRRFLVDPKRITKRFLVIQTRINHRFPLTDKEEVQWISDSVRSRAMESFISENRCKYDWFIFIPYLFGTTYWGIQTVPERSLLIPCLHNEPFAYLGIFKEMFNKVHGIIFNTFPERELAKELYGISEKKTIVVGLGYDIDNEYKKGPFRNKYGIEDPFILYAGRREKGKNIDLLQDYFRVYKKHNNNRLKLVLLGSGEVMLSAEDRNFAIDLGYIPEEYKRSAYAEALVFCQPSVNESLSIVIMESWLAGRPVLVNSRCRVTMDHCRRSRGGLYFSDYPEFEECINYLLKNPSIADEIAKNGREYVKANYSWDAVLDKFDEGLEKFHGNTSVVTGIHQR